MPHELSSKWKKVLVLVDAIMVEQLAVPPAKKSTKELIVSVVRINFPLFFVLFFVVKPNLRLANSVFNDWI